MSQKDEDWKDEYLDNCCESDCTCSAKIGKKGCLLTSIAMASGMTPSELNQQLIDEGGFDENANIMWYKAADLIEKKYVGFAPVIDPNVINSICNGDICIAQVESQSPGNKGGKHFVVVTGSEYDSQAGKCRLTIADPAGKHIFLDEYKSVAIQTFSGENE